MNLNTVSGSKTALHHINSSWNVIYWSYDWNGCTIILPVLHHITNWSLSNEVIRTLHSTLCRYLFRRIRGAITSTIPATLNNTWGKLDKRFEVLCLTDVRRGGGASAYFLWNLWADIGTNSFVPCTAFGVSNFRHSLYQRGYVLRKVSGLMLMVYPVAPYND